MSPAHTTDSEFQDWLFIHGGSGADPGKSNFDDLWELNFSTL
jgi:hypothetical protein